MGTRSCADCKHLKSWWEYGNVCIDCCHKEGSEYFEGYEDAADHCPHWEKVDMGDIDPWGGNDVHLY
jgi:hypothetical protein